MAAYAPLDEADARYASSKSIHYPDDTVLALPETRGTAGLPATPASALLGKPERIPPLSRKQTNLLTAVLRGIPLLDHTRTTSYLKDDEVVRSALRVLPTSASVVEAGEANRMRPRLLTAVIGPGPGGPATSTACPTRASGLCCRLSTRRSARRWSCVLSTGPALRCRCGRLVTSCRPC